MDHLYVSRVRVERPTESVVNGRTRLSYTTVSGGESLPCRLDLQFIRVGDIQPAIVAGKAPDRHGILFCAVGAPIKAGDRLVAIEGPDGSLPVEGVFEIRTIPDSAVGFGSMHHIEVQVWETNRDLDTLWPG